MFKVHGGSDLFVNQKMRSLESASSLILVYPFSIHHFRPMKATFVSARLLVPSPRGLAIAWMNSPWWPLIITPAPILPRPRHYHQNWFWLKFGPNNLMYSCVVVQTLRNVVDFKLVGWPVDIGVGGSEKQEEVRGGGIEGSCDNWWLSSIFCCTSIFPQISTDDDWHSI